MNPQLSVHYSSDPLQFKAESLAKQLSLPLNKDTPLKLWVFEQGLSIEMAGCQPIRVNFNALLCKKYRREGKQLALIRACKPSAGLTILDVTAGWGKEAYALACFGAKVLMIERNPVMAALLEDGLERFNKTDQQNLQLSLKHGDAISYLNALQPQNYPDVIYADPMHPVRKKTALVKKDMQILQQIIGTDQDILKLLTLARKKAEKRVVLKWPQNLKPLIPPDHCIEGKTIRYDIYLSL